MQGLSDPPVCFVQGRRAANASCSFARRADGSGLPRGFGSAVGSAVGVSTVQYLLPKEFP